MEGSKRPKSHKLVRAEREENVHKLLTRLICSWWEALSHQGANK